MANRIFVGESEAQRSGQVVHVLAVVHGRLKLASTKSPSEFIEVSTNHARRQFEIFTEQTKQLAALAQQMTLATAEPLKTSLAKASDRAA